MKFGWASGLEDRARMMPAWDQRVFMVMLEDRYGRRCPRSLTTEEEVSGWLWGGYTDRELLENGVLEHRLRMRAST